VSNLEEEILAVLARGVDAALPEVELNDLALRVFEYQFSWNPPYAAFCRARRRSPETVSHWREIPAIPTDAFKYADLTTVSPDDVRVVYLTSGTTRTETRRGKHLLPSTRLYDTSLLPNFKAHLLPDVDRIRMLVLGPTAPHFPHSSLGHMHTRVMEAFGRAGDGKGADGIFWTEEGPRFEELAAALDAADTPVCMLGTAFGFVRFLDWLSEHSRRFTLPAGSRIMDTGGYKGRSREVPKPELYRLYTELLGIAADHIVNEYGMTELSSQYYDGCLREAASGREGNGAPTRWKEPPPWTRVEVVHGDTLQPLPDGEVGLLRHLDLANLYTVAAVQTDDLGIASGGRFEVLGRAAGAELRGCSLTAEDLDPAR
jgi:hypothetical protein